MRINYSGELGFGVTSKDLILATIGRLGTGGMQGYAVEYAGPAIEALTMENRMTICNMTIEGGGRAGMIAPDETTFEYVRGTPRRPGGLRRAAIERWRELPDRGRARASTARSRSTRPSSRRWSPGGPPREWSSRSPTRSPIPAKMDSPADREAAERALAYMDLKPGTPMHGDPARAHLHRLLHQLADLRPARGRLDRRGAQDRGLDLRGDGRPGLPAGQGPGRGGGPATRSSARRASNGASPAARPASA